MKNQQYENLTTSHIIFVHFNSRYNNTK